MRHLVERMPGERFIYLGDTARVPYGNKSPATVQHYTHQCVRFLLGCGVKAIVIACNTASALALEMARALSPVPVIGVISSAAIAAVHSSQNGIIGVIGTRATIGSHAYASAIQQQATQIHKNITILSRACPLFVPLAEEDWAAHPSARLIAAEYLHPLKNYGCDTLVLGCTHYPLLRPLIEEYMPGVNLIECGEHTASELSAITGMSTAAAMNAATPRVDMFITDKVHAFADIAGRCLGFTLQDPVLLPTEILENEIFQGAASHIKG